MKPEVLASLAALVSAICALITIYFNRSHGKGFIWTKNFGITMISNADANIHMELEVPLFNLGKGNVRFIKMIAKKICLKNNSVESFEMNMDEAYFPEGVPIISYKTKILDDFPEYANESKSQKIVLGLTNIPEGVDSKKISESISKKMEDAGEFIIVIHIFYKDGSWFGLATKKTTMGLSFLNASINYISNERRKQLEKHFIL